MQLQYLIGIWTIQSELIKRCSSKTLYDSASKHFLQFSMDLWFDEVNGFACDFLCLAGEFVGLVTDFSGNFWGILSDFSNDFLNSFGSTIVCILDFFAIISDNCWCLFANVSDNFFHFLRNLASNNWGCIVNAFDYASNLIFNTSNNSWCIFVDGFVCRLNLWLNLSSYFLDLIKCNFWCWGGGGKSDLKIQ